MLLARVYVDPFMCPRQAFSKMSPPTNYCPRWSWEFVTDLRNLIAVGRFKCTILITCYPRQIKSLCVKSARHWIIYKTSIYWINVESNFILMWLTVRSGLLGRDKNTQACDCVATLHLTCLVLSLSPNLVYGKKAFFFSPFLPFFFFLLLVVAVLKSKGRERNPAGVQPKEKSLKQINPMPFKLTW